jgi:hypothetical protein
VLLLDPHVDPITEWPFAQYAQRLGRSPGEALALAAATQVLVSLAGSGDPEHDIPVQRWAREAGAEVCAEAIEVLGRWAAGGAPGGTATPDYLLQQLGRGAAGASAAAQVATWRSVCREAKDWLAGLS